MKELTILAQESGERIDALLARSGYTRSAAARLIEEGKVRRNGAAVKKSDPVRAGDVVTVEPEDAPPPRRPCRRTSPWTWCLKTRT